MIIITLRRLLRALQLQGLLINAINKPVNINMLLRLRLFNYIIIVITRMLVPDLSPIGEHISYRCVPTRSIAGKHRGLLFSRSRERNRERSLSLNGLLEIFALALLHDAFRFTEGFPSCFVPFIACGSRAVLNCTTLPAFKPASLRLDIKHRTWNKTMNEEQRKFGIKHATLSFRQSMIESCFRIL